MNPSYKVKQLFYFYQDLCEQRVRYIVVPLYQQIEHTMNKASEYIITELKNPLYCREINAVYALLRTMDDDELKSLYEILTDQERIDKIRNDIEITHYLGAIAVNEMEDINLIVEDIESILESHNNSTENRSISELLDLLSKNCENRLTIVAELCERFEHQSFEDQKRTIKSLLRYDHDYISHTIMNDYWGEILIDDIVEMWQWCKDRSYNRYIIKYAKEEFVWKHIDEFSITKWDYELLCKRLGNHPDFKIDLSKLYNKFTYYCVLKSLGREIDNEAILGELFSYIRDWIVAPRMTLQVIEDELTVTYPSKFYVSSKLIPIVRDAIWSFSHMKLNEELLFFYEWDSDIRQKVDEILKQRYADRIYNPTKEEMWLLYCKLARQFFPERFAYILNEDPRHIERRNEMMAELKPLIEKFGFEVEDDEESFGVYKNELQSPANDYIITMPSLDEVPF